jgi:hypothetical protein
MNDTRLNQHIKAFKKANPKASAALIEAYTKVLKSNNSSPFGYWGPKGIL